MKTQTALISSRSLFLVVFALGCVIFSNTPVHSKDSSHPLTLKPFDSDGCSGIFDGIPFLKEQEDHSWNHCCVMHDFAYWVGGVELLRTRADAALKVCVDSVFTNENAPELIKTEAGKEITVGTAFQRVVNIMGRACAKDNTPYVLKEIIDSLPEGWGLKEWYRTPSPLPYRWGFGWDRDHKLCTESLNIERIDQALAEIPAIFSQLLKPGRDYWEGLTGKQKDIVATRLDQFGFELRKMREYAQ